MIEVNTLSFRLRLETNTFKKSKCLGTYYFVLFCESPFDVSKSFSEEFLYDSELAPFYTLSDATRFANEMADFWKMQILINPKLDITRLEELTDLWRNLAIKLDPKIPALEPKELSYS